MTNNLKCPYCNENLMGEKIKFCPNVGSCKCAGMKMHNFIWQTIIDGKKAQDALEKILSIDKLDYYGGVSIHYNDMIEDIFKIAKGGLNDK